MKDRITRLENEMALMSQKLQLAISIMRSGNVYHLYEESLDHVNKQHEKYLKMMRDKEEK